MRANRTHIARGLLFLCLGLLALLVGVAVATIEIMLHSGESSVDCAAPPPFVRPRSPEQSVFNAYVLYVGRTDPKYAMLRGQRFGPWAVAYVKHRYWGLPWWKSTVVVLAPGWFQQGGTYFVDGKQWWGFWKFLPLIYTGPCNRTRLLNDAVVDTRVLNQGPPRDSVRIIGRTYRRKPGGIYDPAPGIRVEIGGPAGLSEVSSDADAVYDLKSLPPGHYSIRIEHPDRRDNEEGSHDRTLSPGEVWGRDVYSQ